MVQLNLCFFRPTWVHNPNDKWSVQPLSHSSQQNVISYIDVDCGLWNETVCCWHGLRAVKRDCLSVKRDCLLLAWTVCLWNKTVCCWLGLWAVKRDCLLLTWTVGCEMRLFVCETRLFDLGVDCGLWNETVYCWRVLRVVKQDCLLLAWTVCLWNETVCCWRGLRAVKRDCLSFCETRLFVVDVVVQMILRRMHLVMNHTSCSTRSEHMVISTMFRQIHAAFLVRLREFWCQSFPSLIPHQSWRC